MKTKLTSSTKRRDERGIALIMVMCIIITLSAIVGGFAYVMKVEMTLARNSDYDNDMIWLARSGVEMARYKLTVRCPGQQNIDALNQLWAGGVQPCHDSLPRVPDEFELVCGASGQTAKVSYKITDLSRKFDINTVADPRFPQNIVVLQNALNQMGVTDSGLVQTICDSVQDWIGPRNSQSKLSGAKDDYYLSQVPPYYCKCGYVDDINELLLVKGIKDHPEIFWGPNSTNHSTSAYELKAQNSPFLRDREQPALKFGLVDIFCAGGGSLNLNTAPQNVIEMLPGFNLNETMAEQLVEKRAGVDHVDGNEDDAPLQSAGEASAAFGNQFGAGGPALPPNLVSVQSYAWEVKVDCEIGGYKKEFTAILRRPANGGQLNNLQVVQFWWK